MWTPGLLSLYCPGSLLPAAVTAIRRRPALPGQAGAAAAQGPPAKRGQPAEARREVPPPRPRGWSALGTLKGLRAVGHRCLSHPSQEIRSQHSYHTAFQFMDKNSGLGFLRMKNPNVSVAEEVVLETVFNSIFSWLNAASWEQIASNLCTSGVLNTLGNNIKSNPLLFTMGFHIQDLVLNSQESCDLGTAEDNLCFIQETEAEQS